MIPIGDETPTTRTPVVTWALLLVNVAVFALLASRGADSFNAALDEWGFKPADFSVAALFTSLFLHAGVFHLVGNMLYLWIFGDNVEDVLGHAGFIAYYLGTGIAASLAHTAFNPSSTTPTVGASGAIAGILGAYVVLFPSSRIKVIWWWYWYVRFFKIGAGWFLGFYFLFQFVMAMLAEETGGGGVAYWAHIGGFVAGLAATLILISLRVVKHPGSLAAGAGEPERAGGGMVDGIEFEPGASLARAGEGRVSVPRVVDSVKLPADPARRIDDILEAVSSGKLGEAVNLARVELRIPRKRAADPWQLARVADRFYRKGSHPMALHVYQEVLKRLDPADTRIPEIEFRAGIIASRHVRDGAEARRLLADAARRHDDPKKRSAAQEELARVEENLARTGATGEGGLLEGPCAVIRQTAGPLNICEIGRLVAGETGRPMADVTRLLRGSGGFVATGLTPVEAKRLAARLQERDIPALVIPEEKLIALPCAQEVTWAAVTPEAVEVRTQDGPVESRSWERIYYASAGLVEFTTRKRVPDQLSSMGPRHYGGFSIGMGQVGYVETDGGPHWKYEETRVEKLVFDVFTLEPFACRRLVEGKVDLAGSPQAVTQSSRLNFRRLIADFLAHGREVPVNEGVRLVAAGAPRRDWRNVTFNSIRDFERYNYWRLQLEQYG